ncbi:MAG: hypothetical protein IJB82_01385 [Bacilli bacterium]|nr:hypothetical protein [Bacilli bacterium]
MKQIKIKIAHLYYDLMNLYGENGNIRALKEYFSKQDITAEIHFLTVNDKIDFDEYDIFYMGMGSELNQLIVLEDLISRKKELKKAIENNKYFFFTGNSYELLGKYIIDFNGNKIKCLNIFDFYTKINTIKDLHNASTFRIVGETVAKTNLIKEPIIGFQNRAGTIYDNNYPLFEIVHGTGDKPNDIWEGFKYKNFYGTHIIGPLFIRNPYFTNYFITNIIKEKNKNYKLKLINNSIEVKAYKKYLENFKELVNPK